MQNNSKTDTIIHLIIIGICAGSMIEGLYGYFSSGNHTVNSSGTGLINGSTFDYASFNFTSDTFGIQDDISVSVIAMLDPKFVSTHPDTINLEKLYAYLPNSAPKHITYEHGHYLSNPIELDKQQDGTFRSSLKTIQYVTSGDMCYIISASPNIYSTPNCLPNAQPIIHIASLETVNQTKSNRIMEFLTWVILGFTVIIIGEPIINMKNHFSGYVVRSNDEKNQKNESEERATNQKQTQSEKFRNRKK